MGLIKAAFGAAGGVLADQWKEFFYCEAIPADVLAVKGKKKTTSRSSNTKGDENIITNGVLQGSGDVVFTAVNTISSLVIRCIAAYCLAYLTPIGGAAAWMSLPVGWVYSIFLSLGRYKWGPWRKKAVVSGDAEPRRLEEG